MEEQVAAPQQPAEAERNDLEQQQEEKRARPPTITRRGRATDAARTTGNESDESVNRFEERRIDDDEDGELPDSVLTSSSSVSANDPPIKLLDSWWVRLES